MKNSLYFILLGSLATTLASYGGVALLIFEQKIFISNYPMATFASFIVMYLLSVILWSAGLLGQKTLCRFYPKLNHEKAFLIIFSIMVLVIALLFILFRIYVFEINLSWWVFIFPGLPLVIAQIVSTPLIKRYQNTLKPKGKL